MAKPSNNPVALNPGDLRHRIVIQRQSTAQDANGDPTSTWSDVWPCWAAISTPTAREMYQTGQAGQFVAQVTKLIKIRWPGAAIVIVGGMRVLYRDRTFAVQTVENVQERNRVMNLTCVEVNGGAGCS